MESARILQLAEDGCDLSVKALAGAGVSGGEVVAGALDGLFKQAAEAQSGEVHSHIVGTMLEDQIQHIRRLNVLYVTGGQHDLVVCGANQLLGQNSVGLQNQSELIQSGLVPSYGRGHGQSRTDAVSPGGVVNLFPRLLLQVSGQA